MLKLGVIGLGNIAAKAYLPVYSSIHDVEFHLYTRNQEKLRSVGRQYRFSELHEDMESLLSCGIKGAFIHSATASHEEIIERLLLNGIHVFVDKPITDHYTGAKRLVELAEERGLILMAGFNRRYAPSYMQLRQTPKSNMVIVQKNRQGSPGEVRSKIFDDFIHVVDTMRYLFPYPIEEIIVNGRMDGNMLYHVVLQFISEGRMAIGVMNRDNGTNEETAEVMGPEEKRTAINLTQLLISKGADITEVKGNDWEPTLVKRGFHDMVKDFIQAVQTGNKPKISARDALESHEICEKVIAKLTNNSL